jgi:hypothetical protein
MKFFIKIIIIMQIFCLIVVAQVKDDSTLSSIKPDFYTLNVSLNHLDWTSNTEAKSSQKDFSYLEVEGFAKWDRAEFYMFFDIENPNKNYSDKAPDSRRYALKPVLDIKLFDTNFYIHVQDYMLYSKDFYINNLVTGLAYKIDTDFGLWIKPFIGSHFQKSTYYNGYNGYLGGWVFGYDFELMGSKFSLSQWHEFEWSRDEDDYQLDDGTAIGNAHSHGVQGAFCVWWHPADEITTGVQYRYANHKLGYSGYQAGFIYSLKYNF